MNENPYQPPALGETVESSTPSRPKMSAGELNRLQWEIKKQADNSIVAGALGIVFWIFVPMALISARRAMALIEEHNVGHHDGD